MRHSPQDPLTRVFGPYAAADVEVLIELDARLRTPLPLFATSM